MALLSTTQVSGTAVTDGWVTARDTISRRTSKNTVETPEARAQEKVDYDDPKGTHDFLIAVSFGDSRQENWYHPSHLILQILKDEHYDLASLPTQREKAIHIEHNGLPFRFYRIPTNPVADLHKVEPHKTLADEIFNTLKRAVDKKESEGNEENRNSYEFELLKPVILNFSKISDDDGRNPQYIITYPGIHGRTIHEIKSNFGSGNIDTYSDVDESILLGWLENSAHQIAKSLFA